MSKLISVKSDSMAVLKKSINLCFLESDIKIKSFKRTDSEFVFYKNTGEYKLNDLNADGIYIILVNYLKIQSKLKKTSKDEKFNFTFELFSDDNSNGMLDVKFNF